MNVVVTHWLHAEVLTYLQQFANVHHPTKPGEIWSRKRIVKEAANADALVTCMADAVDDAFLQACPQLKIIAATLKGYDSYDVDACTKHGVWLTNVPDMIIPPTAELALSLALGIMRNVRQGDEIVRSGNFAGWRPRQYGTSLSGSAVGLVGMGALGKSIAQLLSPFGLSQSLYFDLEERMDMKTWTKVELRDLLINCDLIIVSLPLNPSTHHLINSEVLSHIRTSTYLVNIGRGSVVDETAILEALTSERLAGYAADVFEFEDWAVKSRPKIVSKELRQHPRTLFTPHLGSNPDSVRKAMSMSAAEQVGLVMQGETPIYAVNNIK
jgi:Lactate dehydrogenase and related dehydrogenases